MTAFSREAMRVFIEPGARFYHGTSTGSGLKVGNTLLPALKTGKIQYADIDRKQQILNKVFFTRDLSLTKIYAKAAAKWLGGTPVVFEVAPIGEICGVRSHFQRGTDALMANRAKIIGKFPWKLVPDRDRTPCGSRRNPGGENEAGFRISEGEYGGLIGVAAVKHDPSSLTGLSVTVKTVMHSSAVVLSFGAHDAHAVPLTENEIDKWADVLGPAKVGALYDPETGERS